MALRDWSGRRVVWCCAIWLVVMAIPVAITWVAPSGHLERVSPATGRQQLPYLPQRRTEVSWNIQRSSLLALALVPPTVLTLLWAGLRRR